MRPKGASHELEHRRRRAMALLAEGHGVRQVARLIGAAPSSVTVWRQAIERGGLDALTARPHPGRTPKLTAGQRAQLPQLIEQKCRAQGERLDRLTLKQIAAYIQEAFGVRYDNSTVWHLLRKIGWTRPAPPRAAGPAAMTPMSPVNTAPPDPAPAVILTVIPRSPRPAARVAPVPAEEEPVPV